MKRWMFILMFGVINVSIYAQTHSPYPVKADTIFLKNVCEACIYGEGGYAVRPFPDNYLCFCYYNYDSKYQQLNAVMLKYAKDVKVLLIENPSNIISEIPWERLKNLEELELRGNDFDVLSNIPQSILNSTTIKRIIISMITIEEKKWNTYKRDNPQIEFIGSPGSYY